MCWQQLFAAELGPVPEQALWQALPQVLQQAQQLQQRPVEAP